MLEWAEPCDHWCLMVSAPTRSASPASVHWQMPVPHSVDRILGGVAGGIAREVGLETVWIRLSFVILFAIGGWGGLVYLVAWGFMAQMEYLGRGPTNDPVPKGRSSRRRGMGTALVVLALVIFFGGLPGVGADVMWPLGVLFAGMLLVSRQVGSDRLSAPKGRFGGLQLAGGVVLALGGVTLLLFSAFDSGQAGGLSGIIAGVMVAIGLVTLSAPWWWRMVQDLDKERQARVRSDERAEVAAHLHDSVLQTLTLIQKQGDDPQTMRNLARRQERELRNWLDPDRADRTGQSVRGQLDEMATEVEDLHGVPVEVVVVGDCLVTESVAAALAAAREATVNAAKHSGAGRVDVYVEITESQLEVFVRDTGVGFDPENVAADRRGIRESLQGRMARAGGSVTIYSEPGAGTEVEVSVPRPPTAGTPTPGPPMPTSEASSPTNEGHTNQ